MERATAMNQSCKFEQLPRQHSAYVRVRTPAARLPELMGQSYAKIQIFLTQHNLQISGPPYALYFNMDMEDLDVELGFPVNTEFEDGGDVRPGEVPDNKYATCIHKGPYSTLESAYQALDEWTSKQGAQASGQAYEFYLNDPNEVIESELLTKILFPLQKG
jgi:effector-binding domain-containing protein